jgi:hypothetical protein
MFFSDTDILVVQEQHRDRLHEAVHERLVQEIQQSNQKRSGQNISGWVDRLLKPNPNLDWKKSQTI